jgi:hypothetical protein
MAEENHERNGNSRNLIVHPSLLRSNEPEEDNQQQEANQVILVNPKQFDRILKRREARARLRQSLKKKVTPLYI